MILRCIIEGDSNKCIARKIDVTEATVKVHVKAILRKIRVQNRTQAAVWGINNGYTRPESANDVSQILATDLLNPFEQSPKSENRGISTSSWDSKTYHVR